MVATSATRTALQSRTQVVRSAALSRTRNSSAGEALLAIWSLSQTMKCRHRDLRLEHHVLTEIIASGVPRAAAIVAARQRRHSSEARVLPPSDSHLGSVCLSTQDIFVHREFRRPNLWGPAHRRRRARC